MRTRITYVYFLSGLVTLALLLFANRLLSQDQMLERTSQYSLNISKPQCFGESGGITIIAKQIGVSYLAALDSDEFTTASVWEEVTVGSHKIKIIDESGHHTIDFSMMPEEDIGFDFVEVLPANCLGENGRILGAITGSGSSGAEYVGSGTLVFESIEVGPTIDVNVSAGEYTLSAVLNENIRQDSILIVPSENCDVYIPNVIIGSTLSGNNNEFKLFFDEALNPFVLDYLIYDQWGNLIYKRNNFDAAQFDDWWQGDCGDSPCAAGTYVYLVIMDMGGGVIVERKGTVYYLE